MAESETTSAPSETLEEVGNPYLAAVLAWLLPGAGHFYLGRRGRALYFLALFAVALTIGLTLDGDIHRHLPSQPIISSMWAVGAMGMGLPYAVLRFIVDYQGNVTAAGYEYGSAFILTAGLMNLILVLDAWDVSRGQKR